ncbi:uncharacterized protein LOC126844990 [Adelges cooleyi]|uniref:uncharacterized protein LOC126844990 n=1 Tax=Adelges cooleyi TaxID=133065 RepID=UPI00217FDABA|nr:uncharacterized protein LOC126844990 [Adelges cooleyi]XP_050439503.1 uncharacterized protein LOC126844990 [Adelges cooleyi]XP_050439506.1 uncharacterized protein LOC126844990 [Adelges cooleyi]XP_050439507.1 uncharacterized protein LOC126844990 [Adelges cooleyi]
MSIAENKEEDFVGQFLVNYEIQELGDVLRLNRKREFILKQIASGSIAKFTLFLHIKVEVQILELSKQRLSMTEEPIDEDLKTDVIDILKSRVNELYNMLFLLFPPSITILKSYTLFCKKNKLLNECSTTIKILLTLPQPNPELYEHAAEFEANCRKNIEQARQYFEEGMRVHGNKPRELHTSRFSMEVENCGRNGADSSECLECFFKTIKFYEDKHIVLFWEFFFCSLRFPKIEKLHAAIADEIIKIYKRYDNIWYTVQENKFIMDGIETEVKYLLKKDSLPVWEVLINCIRECYPDLIWMMHQKAACSRGKIAKLSRSKILEMLYHDKGLIRCRKEFNKLKLLEPFSVELYQTILHFEVNSNIIQCKNPTIPERIRERERQLKSLRSIYSEACSKFGETNAEIWMDYIRFENDYGDKQNVNNLYEESKNHLSLEHIPTMESEFEQFNTTATDDQVPSGCSKNDEDMIQDIIEIDD